MEDRSFMDDLDTLILRQGWALDGSDMEEFSRLDRIFHRRMQSLVGAVNPRDLVTARSGHI